VSETCRVIINQVKKSCISLVIYLHDILRMHGTMNVKCKEFPIQALTGPECSRRLRHMKMVKLSALRTGRLYHPGNIHGAHFC